MKWNPKFAYPNQQDLYKWFKTLFFRWIKFASVTTILSATKSEEDKAAILAWKQRVGV